MGVDPKDLKGRKVGQDMSGESGTGWNMYMVRTSGAMPILTSDLPLLLTNAVHWPHPRLSSAPAPRL